MAPHGSYCCVDSCNNHNVINRQFSFFRFPKDPVRQNRGIESDKVVVVSIIGKSSLNTSGLKVKSIGRLFPLENKKASNCSIKGSYDEENQIVYLHLYSLLDTDILVEKIGGFDEDKNDYAEDFLTTNDDIKSSFCRYFLFLLHVSHVIVLSHPGTSFDTNYIQYFRALDGLRKKLLDKICNRISSVEEISAEWADNGRPCIPRIIFYFERANTDDKVTIKKMEHNLEDKIYHILKKTRIVTTSSTSLFAIPLNDEFVYVSEERPKDRLGEAIRGLIQDCQPGGAMQIEAPFSNQPYSDKDFHKFLNVHIQLAKSKGFNDVVSSSRHQQASNLFELPALNIWIEVTKVLYQLIITEHKPISSLSTDTRFSEQRCLKVLPLAIARYQEGLPPHYGKSEHEARLAVALSLFRTQARGPKYPHYEAQLELDCQAHWENGRQQCEVASMTGNPCKLSKHPSDQEHISGFVFKSVCDCGKTTGPRDDPYTAMQANYIFYQQMAKDCNCSKLERIEFPIFEPSIKEFKAATLNETEEAMSVLSDRSVQLTPDVDKGGLVRQPSTTEYLPGMLTLTSPPGLLPVFSSWSLVCIGASSIYSHNLGLPDSYQPGFLTGTNYLLPWDVVVASKSKKAWPAIGKFSNRGRRGRPATTSLPQSVKLFIGLEYECASGHRFMLSSPERILKAAPGSIVKETGHKIAESDMPLYHPCTCRAVRTAQLMKIHVVTPKAPVFCTLNPKIQPASGAPIFVCDHDAPIKLKQSSYWVMRLPFVYEADKNHYKQNISGKLLRGAFGVMEAE